MAKQQEVKWIEVSKVKTIINARQDLDQSRVLFFEAIIDAKGVEGLDPIELYPGFIVKAGNNRLQAAINKGIAKIRYIDDPETDHVKQVLGAFASNIIDNQPLPPNLDDLARVATQLFNELGRTGTRQQLVKSTGWPTALVDKAVAFAWRRWEERKIEAALKAVRDGECTLAAAATQFDIGLDRLQDRIDPKGKNKQKQLINKYKEKLTNPISNLNKSYGQQFKKMMDDINECRFTENEGVAVLRDMLSKLKKTENEIENKIIRLENMKADILPANIAGEANKIKKGKK